MPRIREYETKGSFGMCIDLVSEMSYNRTKSQISKREESDGGGGGSLKDERDERWINRGFY